MMTATLAFGPVPFMADSPSDSRNRPAPAVSALTSVELLARAQSGDELALNELFARYMPRLRKWAHGRLPLSARSGLDTQDMVQDAIARVVPRIASFEPLHDGGFYGYLRTAVQHRIQDQINWAKRRPTAALASDRPATDPSPIEQAIGGETLDRYEAALQRLPKVDREAIVLRIELGLPYTEIAQALGKPSVPATHVAVSRALVKLAKEMSRVTHD
jgi:RNA polymerase sigma-70 factor (ECF subfamily)